MVNESPPTPEKIINGYIVEKTIGRGAFGRIVKVTKNNNDGKEYALKIPKKGKERSLVTERKFLEKLQGSPYFPKIIDYREGYEKNNYLAMELLGPSLGKVKDVAPCHRLSLSTSIRVGIEMLRSIRAFHKLGFIHRDIKPDNFLVRGSRMYPIVLIDYGISRRYLDAETGRPIPPRPFVGFVGTMKYASINAHEGRELGRRDDLYSWFVSLLVIMTDHVPWKTNRNNKIMAQTKKITNIEKFCLKLPKQLVKIYYIIMRMKFGDEPKYDLLIAFLNEALKEVGGSWSEKYDWENFSKNRLNKISSVNIVPPHDEPANIPTNLPSTNIEIPMSSPLPLLPRNTQSLGNNFSKSQFLFNLQQQAQEVTDDSEDSYSYTSSSACSTFSWSTSRRFYTGSHTSSISTESQYSSSSDDDSDSYYYSSSSSSSSYSSGSSSDSKPSKQAAAAKPPAPAPPAQKKNRPAAWHDSIECLKALPVTKKRRRHYKSDPSVMTKTNSKAPANEYKKHLVRSHDEIRSPSEVDNFDISAKNFGDPNWPKASPVTGDYGRRMSMVPRMLQSSPQFDLAAAKLKRPPPIPIKKTSFSPPTPVLRNEFPKINTLNSPTPPSPIITGGAPSDNSQCNELTDSNPKISLDTHPRAVEDHTSILYSHAPPTEPKPSPEAKPRRRSSIIGEENYIPMTEIAPVSSPKKEPLLKKVSFSFDNESPSKINEGEERIIDIEISDKIEKEMQSEDEDKSISSSLSSTVVNSSEQSTSNSSTTSEKGDEDKQKSQNKDDEDKQKSQNKDDEDKQKSQNKDDEDKQKSQNKDDEDKQKSQNKGDEDKQKSQNKDDEDKQKSQNKDDEDKQKSQNKDDEDKQKSQNKDDEDKNIVKGDKNKQINEEKKPEQTTKPKEEEKTEQKPIIADDNKISQESKPEPPKQNNTDQKPQISSEKPSEEEKRVNSDETKKNEEVKKQKQAKEDPNDEDVNCKCRI
ncbi:CK1 family protein kinase [Trichomonas vaginalis G3]|uniref:non-specific serine/threonine protein kinase n=1 Tax=Trichomonas vaginalis (strain ATCC PRA-98 / G3) TaxID=412133 RepID=A2DY64_TRIV3|nr:protein kinase protein [Trichomonas vaginalis G3]EAY14673.1 CK1 family protein kinase [Trichomonas vaginalis G3]KAI5505426.1 protein kinase protein [Trichomonas vaginalis G3]|eukprot:XP_001326896.1 CK1 family protein kinase [Trichomonas vaginalis G3]